MGMWMINFKNIVNSTDIESTNRMQLVCTYLSTCRVVALCIQKYDVLAKSKDFNPHQLTVPVFSKEILKRVCIKKVLVTYTVANIRKCLKKWSHIGKLVLLKRKSDLKTMADATAVTTTCMPWAFHDCASNLSVLLHQNQLNRFTVHYYIQKTALKENPGAGKLVIHN